MNNIIKTLITSLLLYCSAAVAEQKQPSFSHDLFQNVITQHVADGIVDYPAINNNLDYHTYIANLQNTAQLRNNSEVLSYWINAYNALAIKGILDGRSPESFFGKIGYFYNAEYSINGLTMNLYDLEHKIIIPLTEPRIHFALNCASASCPKLYDKVFLPETLEQQLEHVATIFINDPTRNQFDLQSKTARISKIFDWFTEDFEKHSGSVQNYLALYVADNEISTALANDEFEIEYLEYDWTLNGIPPVLTKEK